MGYFAESFAELYNADGLGLTWVCILVRAVQCLDGIRSLPRLCWWRF